MRSTALHQYVCVRKWKKEKEKARVSLEGRRALNLRGWGKRVWLISCSGSKDYQKKKAPPTEGEGGRRRCQPINGVPNEGTTDQGGTRVTGLMRERERARLLSEVSRGVRHRKGKVRKEGCRSSRGYILGVMNMRKSEGRQGNV